ncbi:MAG: AzlC family ABC transporter permease [Vibrio sp.]
MKPHSTSHESMADKTLSTHNVTQSNQAKPLEDKFEPQAESKGRLFWQGTLAMLPLSIAVIPWGILAGSFAIDAGLSLLQSQGLSFFVFAGAAQLVAVGMIKAGAGLFSLAMTTLLITSRHFLYSLAMREQIKTLPLHWRLTLGFLLTDELFAICGHQTKQQFKPWYALGAGFSFYLSWNAATLVGILAGHSIPNLESFGLEFAVAATFIALVVPKITSLPVLATVITAFVMTLLLQVLAVDGSLMIASLSAMVVGYLTQVQLQKRQSKRHKPTVKEQP